jgi:hypothetical protein
VREQASRIREREKKITTRWDASAQIWESVTCCCCAFLLIFSLVCTEKKKKKFLFRVFFLLCCNCQVRAGCPMRQLNREKGGNKVRLRIFPYTFLCQSKHNSFFFFFHAGNWNDPFFVFLF